MVSLYTSNHCVVHLWLHICHLCPPVSAFSAGNASENVLILLTVLPFAEDGPNELKLVQRLIKLCPRELDHS